MKKGRVGNRLRAIASSVLSNRILIIITFELFWIVVFLLDRITGMNSGDIPQFIYVKF